MRRYRPGGKRREEGAAGEHEAGAEGAQGGRGMYGRDRRHADAEGDKPDAAATEATNLDQATLTRAIPQRVGVYITPKNFSCHNLCVCVIVITHASRARPTGTGTPQGREHVRTYHPAAPRQAATCGY